jgi:hypothetical protein
MPTAVQLYVLRFHPHRRSALLVLVYRKGDAHGSIQGLAPCVGRTSGKFYEARHACLGGVGWHCLLLGLQRGRNPQQEYEQ